MERRIPLEALVLGMHEHGPQYRTTHLRAILRQHPAVRSYGSTDNLEEARALVLHGEVNTIFVDPWITDDEEPVDLIEFIREIRKIRPNVVFVVYADANQRTILTQEAPELEHYFSLELEEPRFDERGDMLLSETASNLVDAVLGKCERWHREQFQYDVAVSFAGSERDVARSLANALVEVGASVFFDEFEEASLLGKDLYDHLTTIYSRRARYSLMLVSRSYSERVWTTLERRAMQERALLERGKEYVIPVRVDDTPLTGLLSTIGYVSIAKGPATIARLVANKLWVLDAERPKLVLGTSRPEYEVS